MFKKNRVLRAVVFRTRRIFGVGYLERFLKAVTYYGDGVATHHLVSFREDPKFKLAIGRANEATPFTYGFEFRIAQILWAGNHIKKFNVPGVMVELGTGFGYSMLALLNGVELNERECYLFDTFEPFYLDEFGNNSPLKAKHPYYAPNLETVEKNFQEFHNVNLIKGDCRITVPLMLSRIELDAKEKLQIAFLHLDLNYGETEVKMFELLFPHLSHNAVVIFDDFGQRNHQNQNVLIKDLALRFDLNLLETVTGQGIAIIFKAS